ncbi:MAG: hypothetical protein QCH35_11465, partial [Methanomicrobiaceae archaeon]|nr:hypothetical protein [Methanomicrobiaceae archaeon]
MPRYDPGQSVIERSLAELRTVVAWVNERDAGAPFPTTILIGGWAVDAYNPYVGSVDIDLVTNSTTRRSLMHHLVHHRGFHYRQYMHHKTVEKGSGAETVILDFYSRERPDPFEGGRGALVLDFLDGHTVTMPIRGDIRMAVPARGALLVMKLKAVWDRSFRYEHGRSSDPEWEYSKCVKDNADVLALLDPAHGGHDLDLELLGGLLNRHPFLKGCIERLPELDDARDKYERMDRETIRRICEDF